jgi:hypothetical protein
MDPIVRNAAPSLSDSRAYGEVLVHDAEEARITQIVAQGPRGALAVTALSVGIVVTLWVAFYLFVFLPRGTIG